MKFLITQSKEPLVLRLLHKFHDAINARVNNYCPQFLAFSIFGLINYPIYYIIWTFTSENNYENFTLRLIATLLCFGLLLRNKWPKSWKKWLPLYWYFTLAYCLPFFFTFMWLHNPESMIWVMTFTSISFWLVLLTDLPSAFALLFIGVATAVLSFALNNDASFLPGYFYTLAPEYIGCLVVIAIFANNKARFEKGKLDSMQELAATIAHELRTPLAAIKINAQIIGECPQENGENGVITAQALTYINKEVELSNTFIDMLLVKVEHKIDKDDLKVCSIQACLNQALSRYPFHDVERSLVFVKNTDDFKFYGTELMIIHVLFNLFKNALYAITDAGKGEIAIWVEEGTKYNKLYFKDTGSGIPADIQHRVFERFFGTTTHGAGVGLQYCKTVMTALGGKITLDSIEHEYTEFVLYFPKIDNKEEKHE
jgi:signal transduction histidine kinase